jgi:hypothetical protein
MISLTVTLKLFKLSQSFWDIYNDSLSVAIVEQIHDWDSMKLKAQLLGENRTLQNNLASAMQM